MKNLKYILLIVAFLFLNFESFAQLPLQFGDGVVTHSEQNNSSAGGTVVLRLIKTRNTSTASPGTSWNTAADSPAGLKPFNYTYPNWTNSNLGNIFGITLDGNPNPNIYVSNTQIFSGSSANASKVYRIDGTTGTETLVYNFNNGTRSLGNLKYAKIGGVENIYVSNFDNGKIERLNGNSTTTTAWTLQTPFNPKFNQTVDDPHNIPYGLAIRKIGTKSRLYYAKASDYYYNTCEVWSVDLDNVGDFIPSSETKEVLPLFTTTAAIADIAFSEDNNRMLIGQQTWNGFAKLSAHQSNVYELNFDLSLVTSTNPSANVHNWTLSPNNYPTNGSINPLLTGIANSSVGGVSYSNNVLFKQENDFDCDKTIWFTADAMIFSTVLVYGVKGMITKPNTISDGIMIDEDDYQHSADKYQLGDVEIYKNPLNCNPCQCGNWENIALNNNSNWWIGGTPLPPLPTLTFNQGSSTGILFPHYICNGNCNATYTYTLTNSAGNTTNLSGTSSLDLSQQIIKNLPCGSYFINITPKCGNVNCPPVRIPLVIVCPPPCSDCGGNATVTSNGTPTISNGLISGNFTINNSKPVSEIRVLVEEFRVTSNNENCLICKNPPKTWGSIQTATLGALSPALSNAVTIDNREVVFNNNAILPLPSNLAISLALPQSVGLSCCEVQVQVCLKFIIRDVNCCEKEILKCFTFTLPQTNNLSGGTGTSTGGTSGTGNPTGGTAGNYPNMDSTGKCLPNYKDCDGILANGCEVNITNNSSNCGTCGNMCPPGKTCVGGTCL